jgi:formylglycine-generating enzyme required for sulfatase activity
MEPTHLDWLPPEIFDEYRLVKALGRGSMGQVWLAQDTVLDRLVAVKFIAELPAHDTVRQRFLTEARAAARVQHTNIIAVYRVGEIGLRPYLISEYVRGDSLDTIARPVAWPRLLKIALGLARGLAAAHRGGVLHRDIKPANAILSETGEVKLLDFGLAKLLPHVAPPDAEVPAEREMAATLSGAPSAPTGAPRADREPFVPPSDQHIRTVVLPAGGPASGHTGSGIALPSVTSAGAVMGTPSYMPPEAWRGEPATPRSDVYSLGAMLYELGAGAPPHRGDSPELMWRSVLDRDAPPLATVAPGIDPRFAAVVDRCLRRDPAERFASGDAVREALEVLAAGDKTAASRYARLPRARRLRRARQVIVTGAALALALFAYSKFSGDHSPRSMGGGTGTCPRGMVPVPAGTFWMGSSESEGDPDEHPQHEVTLSAYCIDRTEVTVEAYAECVAAGQCSAAPLTVHWTDYSAEVARRNNRWCNRQDRPEHPINCVDWEQVAGYCRWKGKRLPTEAEWEYAARGHDGRVHPWGNEAPNAKRLNVCGGECIAAYERDKIQVHVTAMYDGNDGWETTAPVGSYPEGTSPFGALDMAGNVWEWTADWYGAYSKLAETNPQGPKTGTSRVSRGGGWATVDTNKVRAADRSWLTPTTRDVDLGFRCARGN